MLLKISSRDGVFRLEVPESATVIDLKRMIYEKTNIETDEQILSFRKVPSIRNTVLLDSNALLADEGVTRGTLIFLESSAPMEKSDLDSLKEEGEASTGKNASGVVEHELDRALRKESGWIKRSLQPQCRHLSSGCCSHCEDIPPWRIRTLPEFEKLNLKHLTFHAWLHEKEYNNLNNPVFLYDPCYCMKIGDDRMAFMNKVPLGVVLERQVYRHVDHVNFESSDIVERFIEAWRSTGKQRFGYLYGKYVRDSTIPLGVQAIVMAIYEPPQVSTSERVYILKDPDCAMIDGLARDLAMERVGCIWTSLKVNEKQQIINDRQDLALTAVELYRSSGFQNRYAALNVQSDSGNFGSKFVSVVVHGNEDGTIGIWAYQASNQYASLVRDKVIIPSKRGDGLFRVKRSTDGHLYPDILYSQKNEYGIDIQRKADPTFPVEFGIVSLGYSTPINPNPTFKSNKFPIENRRHFTLSEPSATDIQMHIQSNYPACLKDWHFLMHLARIAPQVLKLHVLPLIHGDNVDRQSNFDETRKILERLGHPPTEGSHINEHHQKMIDEIIEMGCTHEMARATLEAVDYSSVENALNLMLNE